MLKKLHISNGKLVECDDNNAVVSVYVAPDENERRYLVDQLKIDEHTLNSSLDPDEPSRLEFEPEHIAMICKRPKHYSQQDEFLFRILSVGIFIFKGHLVIVVAEDFTLFDGKIFNRVTSILDIALKLIFRAVLHFVEHLRAINRVSTDLELQINVAMENTYLLNMFTLEKSLVYYLNAIHSNAVLVSRLKSYSAKIGFTQENLEFLDDISIENNQSMAQTEIFSQVLASMMDARASIISNNLNIRIKALTLVTIAIMLPTLVVSIFSMNVRIPLAQLHNAFWIIFFMAFSSSIVMAVLWWRKKW
ncbi:MAG: magnesium transporter CorA family protein [Planctomycetes bacterium]|nr:magnesium transporter CorA family protein [Planctomycetota bacterium]MBU1518609.1 magnesium transporter CorA family protein [Planctomycetota bacterium]MBU2458543.1 magnesium transporter CorA family protein [Planctomycetota bacterium]MBU2596775.1 magnesium transporter CorA family protein [Planctomycetota bacterium]